MSLEICGAFPVSREAGLPAQAGLLAGVAWQPLGKDDRLLSADSSVRRIILADWPQVPAALAARSSSSAIALVTGLGRHPSEKLLIDLLNQGMDGYLIVPLPRRELEQALAGLVRTIRC